MRGRGEFVQPLLPLLQERVSELEADVREKHRLEVKVQSLQEVLRVLYTTLPSPLSLFSTSPPQLTSPTHSLALPSSRLSLL